MPPVMMRYIFLSTGRSSSARASSRVISALNFAATGIPVTKRRSGGMPASTHAVLTSSCGKKYPVRSVSARNGMQV